MSESSGGLDVGVEAVSADTTVVRVDGELDMATVAKLEEALASIDRGRRTIVDLTLCTFLDSSAVRALVAASRTADEAGGTITLVASDPAVVRVLEIAAIDTMMPVHATLDEAS